MDQLSEFIEAFQVAFEHVFNLKVISAEQRTESFPKAGETQVAALSFHGDYSGRISIILKDENVDDVAGIIMKNFLIDFPMETQFIFAELINIFAGNLAMELEKRGIAIQIGLPEAEPEKVQSLLYVSVIRLLSDRDILFKFNLYN